MIIRKILSLLLISLACAATQNEQTEGSGDLQNLVNANGEPGDQEVGSGQAQLSVTAGPSESSYADTYLDEEFEPSIEEAPLSSDSWKVDNTGNDIIFVEEAAVEGGGVTNGVIGTDDEDYVAEISGGSPLEEAEEETNVLGGLLTLHEEHTRTLDSPTRVNGNEIDVIAVEAVNSTSVHRDGNALGKTGDKGTVWLPVFDNFTGLPAILLLSAAVVVGALLSVFGFVLVKYVRCGKSTNIPPSKADPFYLE